MCTHHGASGQAASRRARVSGVERRLNTGQCTAYIRRLEWAGYRYRPARVRRLSPVHSSEQFPPPVRSVNQ